MKKWLLKKAMIVLQNYFSQHGMCIRTYRITSMPGEDMYIGTLSVAITMAIRGILPVTVQDDDEVCSIGFCVREGKWYGWSHRAMCGFGIGDKVEEGSCCAVSGWTQEAIDQRPELDVSLPVGFEAKTLLDAKRMAIAFSESVG